MFDIVGVDMPCLDLNVNVGQFPRPNGGARVQQLSWQGGGKVASGMVAAARLGAKCAMMGAVGDDKFGKFCIMDFNRHGIDTSAMAIRTNDTTSLSIVLSDTETGGRSFVFNTGTSAKYVFSEFEKDMLCNTRFLFVTSMDDETVQAVALARASGAKIIIDADAYSERTMELIQSIDIFIASEFVYERLFKDDDYEKNCREIIDKGPEIVVFTFGEKGCVGLSEEGFFRLPAFEVDVADTVGAGDVYHGAFIAALLENLPVRECARYASAVSAIKCTRIGGRAGIPNRQTLQKFLDTGVIDYTEIDQRVEFYKRGLEHV